MNLNHESTMRQAFGSECFSQVIHHPDYKTWQEDRVKIPLVTFGSVQEQEIHDEIFNTVQTKQKVARSNVSNVSKNDKEQKGCEESHKETFTITRQCFLVQIFLRQKEMLTLYRMTEQIKKNGYKGCICKSNY